MIFITSSTCVVRHGNIILFLCFFLHSGVKQHIWLSSRSSSNIASISSLILLLESILSSFNFDVAPESESLLSFPSHFFTAAFETSFSLDLSILLVWERSSEVFGSEDVCLEFAYDKNGFNELLFDEDDFDELLLPKDSFAELLRDEDNFEFGIVGFELSVSGFEYGKPGLALFDKTGVGFLNIVDSLDTLLVLFLWLVIPFFIVFV